jgi:hypothetical protein
MCLSLDVWRILSSVLAAAATPSIAIAACFESTPRGTMLFEWREKRWLEDHDGQPPTCGGAVRRSVSGGGFRRSTAARSAPARFVGAFKRPEVQAKITETHRERYGADRASMLPEAREALSKAKTGVKHPPVSGGITRAIPRSHQEAVGEAGASREDASETIGSHEAALAGGYRQCSSYCASSS